MTWKYKTQPERNQKYSVKKNIKCKWFGWLSLSSPRILSKMTDRHKLLTETKKLLKSVLNTNKTGCTIARLNKEYKDLVGKPIPFRELGHHTLEDFLSSAKDTIIFEDDGKGAKIVKVKVDRDIAHINKFVQQQKVNNPNSQRSNTYHGGRNRFSTSHRDYSGSKIPPHELQSKIVGLVKEAGVII